MTTSDRIKILRKKNLNLTQTEFADILGTNRSVINNVENNRLKHPDQKKPLYLLICEKFNVNYEWLVNGEGEMFKTLTKSEQIAEFAGKLMIEEDESFKKQFIEVLAELDPEDWLVLEKLANSLIKNRK
ncbi:transcriptional regulator with XRE-family HTH domain [Lachnospiraceae bacterium PF1-21]